MTSHHVAGLVKSAAPTRLLFKLCHHFSLKVDATWSDDRRVGRVDFGFGECELAAADDALTLRARAGDEAGLARVIAVFDSHVTQFGARDGLTVRWDDSEEAPR